ncbi:MAG: glycosyltransferase family 4 protein [Gammaproteobacteria bacterium]|nr:glycosyltransferase family 4 protein [Gammaproteobacteria bacterium]
MTDDNAARGEVLQLCPHDHPPFADLCVVYAKALRQLGLKCTTVFFSPPLGTPVKSAMYLHAKSLRDSKALARDLDDQLPRPSQYRLAICHRYRSWRVLKASAIEAQRTVAVAHEFHFFDKTMRKILVRFDRRTVFAGISPAVVEDLRKSVARCICLPNAVDVDREKSAMLSRDEAQERLGLEAGPFTIGVVGRLHPKKQPELALEAFRAAKLEGARLVFVGDGPLRGRLEQGDPGVVFSGFVPDARRCYRGLDALLLTSGDVEAFGMVALEGLLAGIPVICQNVAGPADVLGDMGFYYERPDPNAIALALRAVQTALIPREEWAQRAEARVRAEYSVEAVARRIAAELNLTPINSPPAN